jgi:hypothetical protein
MKGICVNTGERLFTDATRQVVQRVIGWIDAGEVADPPNLSMYTDIGTKERPRWISRRDTCKLEGSNTRDHAVFQPGHTSAQKANARLALSIVRRNHDRQAGNPPPHQSTFSAHLLSRCVPLITQVLTWVRVLTCMII